MPAKYTSTLLYPRPSFPAHCTTNLKPQTTRPRDSVRSYECLSTRDYDSANVVHVRLFEVVVVSEAADVAASDYEAGAPCPRVELHRP